MSLIQLLLEQAGQILQANYRLTVDVCVLQGGGAGEQAYRQPYSP